MLMVNVLRIAFVLSPRREGIISIGWQRCKRDAVKLCVFRHVSRGNSTPFLRSLQHWLATALALARTLGRNRTWVAHARSRDRDTLCSLHRGLAAAWVINVTIERSEYMAVNGVTFNVGRLLNSVL